MHKFLTLILCLFLVSSVAICTSCKEKEEAPPATTEEIAPPEEAPPATPEEAAPAKEHY
jgi:hypothetical protein